MAARKPKKTKGQKAAGARYTAVVPKYVVPKKLREGTGPGTAALVYGAGEYADGRRKTAQAKKQYGAKVKKPPRFVGGV